jgi:2-polyprenyl-3-methyl-5-hydroxy-6-metoxy-1,4-benzoquinol methylase
MLSGKEIEGIRTSVDDTSGGISHSRLGCNFCGSQEHTSLFHGFDPDIVRCNSCGLIFNAAMPTDQELASIYGEDYYTSKDSLRYGYTDYLADRDNIIKTSRRRLARIEKIKAGGSLFDVGCAFGFFLEVARERGWTVSGLEISRFAADYATRHLGLDVANQNAEAWDYGSRRYDVITMWDLIEHLRDPTGTLAKLARALKDDGVLVLSTPDVESWPARLVGDRWLGWQLRNEHLHYFSQLTLGRMLNSAGLEVISSGHIGKHVTFDLFIDRLALYGRAPAALLARLRKLFPRPWSFYINPLDIICVYARLRTRRDVS